MGVSHKPDFVGVFITSFEISRDGQGNRWSAFHWPQLLSQAVEEMSCLSLNWPTAPVLSTEAFATEKQQSWQIQTAHAASVSQHTDPGPAASAPTSTTHAARGPLGSHHAARPFATFGAPLLPALMHVLSLNLMLGLVPWSRLLNAKGFFPWHIWIWLICTEVI